MPWVMLEFAPSDLRAQPKNPHEQQQNAATVYDSPDSSVVDLFSPSTSTSTVAVGQPMSSQLVRLVERHGQGQGESDPNADSTDKMHVDGGLDAQRPF